MKELIGNLCITCLCVGSGIFITTYFWTYSDNFECKVTCYYGDDPDIYLTYYNCKIWNYIDNTLYPWCSEQSEDYRDGSKTTNAKCYYDVADHKDPCEKTIYPDPINYSNIFLI